MINETQEEILESIWKASENGFNSMESVKKQCAVEFNDEDLLPLTSGKLVAFSDGSFVLTDTGKELARKIVRRHRIAEVLVTSVLKLKTAEMERVACEVEHSLHPEVEQAICTLLGHPEFCPDGNPIPKGPCCRERISEISNTVISLAALNPHERGKVAYIKPDSHSILEQLISFGMSPGVMVSVLQAKPVFCIKLENTELALDKDVVKNIFVWRVDGQSD